VDEYLELKRQIVDAGVYMIRTGLVYGTGGNISARLPGMNYFYITPRSLRAARPTSPSSLRTSLGSTLVGAWSRARGGRPPNT